MMDVGRHPKIKLFTYSEVESVSGYVGQFAVRVRKKARSLHEELCTGCGACMEKCPAKTIDTAFEAGMGKRRAIYRPFAQAIPNLPVIDREHCTYFLKGKCKLCAKLCPTGAIWYEQPDEMIDIEVGAIVVATGVGMWDPKKLPQYSYGRSPNILTGLQFERLSSATGPTAGQILTAEGKKPEKVAIIHCVGSRDVHPEAHAYCSRVCCMYSLKHAHQVREKTGAEVYDFFMDMRTFGKAYEEFYDRIQHEGVNFIRGRGAEVFVQPDGKLRVKGEDANLGMVLTVDADMVILASAIEPQADSDQVASLFGLGRTSDRFFAEAHPKLRPVETSTAGVFLAGACQGPRDVPDAVAHGGAAALEAVRLFNQGEVTISPTVAVVEPKSCVGCGDCVIACPYTAISRSEDGKAVVNPALCQGCGTCAATCPAGAISALHFTDEAIVAQIDALTASLG
jgi:heterodisulfide reductase subunit A